MSRKTPLAGVRVATALVCLAALAACGARQPPPAPTTAPLDLQIEALEGGQIELRRYRGRPVVLHFFTTWSLGAQADVDQLTAAKERHGDEVVIVGVAMDQDGYRLVAPWRRASRVPYLVGLASPELVAGRTPLGRIAEVPTTVVLGPEGTIRRRIDRPLAAGELSALLRELVPAR